MIVDIELLDGALDGEQGYVVGWFGVGSEDLQVGEAIADESFGRDGICGIAQSLNARDSVFFAVGVERFGDAVGVKEESVAGGEFKMAHGELGLTEHSEGHTG